mmetsp:Transcript_35360/g.67632  ORF Transcript_35360/g.67632 Transcript_35360/m.67632 type:complete len:532 (+) Transcript_35360:123-1718(+)
MEVTNTCGEFFNNTCTLTELLSDLTRLESKLEDSHFKDLELGVDTMWQIIAATLVIFMQAGFAMLEAGAIRSKNVRSILLKNVIDFSVGTVAFTTFGYALAFGSDETRFFGDDLFFLHRSRDDSPELNHAHFVFMLPFAATATTIVSGAMAERTRLNSYLLISFILTGFVTPAVMHWVWSKDGFLATTRNDPLFGTGVVDFAGSGVIHATGGMVALIGAYLVGPRHDEKGALRFSPMCRPRDFIGHNVIFSTLGMFILWFGWYGFNAGSSFYIVGESAVVAARVTVNTTIAAATASVTVYVFEYFGSNDIALCLNGVLAGLVSITAPCSVVNAWEAAIIGVVGALVYEAASRALVLLEIDDPLDASAMHTGCGVWGMISVGLLSEPDMMRDVFGMGDDHYGVFHGGSGNLLGAQIVGVLVILLWVLVTCTTMFLCIKLLPGLLGLDPTNDMLRVPLNEEIKGLDVSYHDGDEYPPYLWPLVENLKALRKVQESMAAESSHIGQFSQMGIAEGNEHDIGPGADGRAAISPAI